MTSFFLFLAFVAGLVLGYGVLTRKPKERFLATAEYWVYLPGEELPNQDKIMERMLRGNPHRPGGRSPIGKEEALLFSDVRLHIALVKRSRNAHVFRPDLFEDHIVPRAEDLEALAEANSFVKIRYVSEEPLPNRRYLQFLLHAADAVAALGGGRLVFDPITERLIPLEELRRTLDENLDVTLPAFHVQSIWKSEPSGGHAETRGLRKVGLSELKTAPVHADERLLVGAILDETAQAVWDQAKLPASVEVGAYEDRFQILIDPEPNKPAVVRILRFQS